MRALLSVYDKTGIVELARRLDGVGCEIISTGQTKAAIESGGVAATAVSDVTGFPEILGGRVKTLHPAIHGGLLARRDRADHLEEIRAHGIMPIDIVVSNLYPFSDVVARPESTLDDALENIDIGGPAMIRAAAKNFPSILVITDPSDYDWMVSAIEEGGLERISLSQRRALAAKAFGYVAAYDAVIRQYLDEDASFPTEITVAGRKLAELRYGENPHQQGALYAQLSPAGAAGVATWNLLGGKEMSYLNYVDADAALGTAQGFDRPACAIVKHASPCGIATASSVREAYTLALASDPVSAFGGIVAVNRAVDVEAARLMAEHFFDVIVAPAFDDGALSTLRRRKNVRLIEAPSGAPISGRSIRQVDGGFLIQDVDDADVRVDQWRTVTRREPTPEERSSLAFAWRSVRSVKSNAIVLARGTATVGIGGGQPNRVDAVRIAIERAGERVRGSVLASDAYFPFADNIDVAAAAGITAIAEPGGSVRDQEVIEAADRAGIAMVFTGVRHFRH
jgi:phosphoribosylaminoimidazolecarboxamide formyltransferase/IMP cyclohydrolase